MKDPRVDAFKGMNNVLTKAKGLNEPSTILNAHVDADGALEKREGYQKVIDLPGAHSMWTDGKGTVLCMAKGVLYRVVDGSQTYPVISTGQPDAPAAYLEISGLIYISNAHWTGIYDPATESCEPWGVPLPDAPILVAGDGSLPAGTYQVCFTVPGPRGRPSGNGSLVGITLTDPGGISILNLPAQGLVWMTDPNGSQLYYAGNGDVITELPDSPEPIPTMWASPPLPMSSMGYAHGRVWGGRDGRLYYSEPYQPELFRLVDGFFDLGNPVGMIAKTTGGLYVGCKDETFFFAGTTPVEMVQRSVAPGVVPGTLCYANNLGRLGANVPVWIGKGGVYAGSADGQVVNVVKEKIQVDPQQDPGAAIYRVKDGQTRMMFSYQQNGGDQNIAMGDDAACEVIRKGTVI
ncbi:MAG: hypothetical protein JEZ12_13090 [Desulfobacterium sp.]|nr:hypothetical protein [Desulfobacterium sp.]